jgi:alpha-D-xyloside xylohydrolase
VGDRKGSFNGMLPKRIFRINLITPQKTKGWDVETKSEKEIGYEGKKLVIKSGF